MSEVAKERSTRKRLIEAAGQLLAEKGFKETTVRDICEQAGANVAAVNYHFGDKEKLYEEVVLHIFNTLRLKFPLDSGFAETALPEQQLHHFILNLLYRRLDPDRPAWQVALFSQEIMNPRPVVLSIFEEEVGRNMKFLSVIIEKLLEPDSGSDLAELCLDSVMGQVMHYAHVRGPHVPPVLRREPPTAQEILRTARHITDFSLAGIERVREAGEEGRSEGS